MKVVQIYSSSGLFLQTAAGLSLLPDSSCSRLLTLHPLLSSQLKAHRCSRAGDEELSVSSFLCSMVPGFTRLSGSDTIIEHNHTRLGCNICKCIGRTVRPLSILIHLHYLCASASNVEKKIAKCECECVLPSSTGSCL